MPLSLVEVAANSAKLTVPWGDDPEALHLEFYPGRITEKALALSQVAMGDDLGSILAGFQEFNETLAPMIKSWDLYVDTERTTLFPIDAKRFPEIPIALRSTILGAILKAFRPNAEATQE